MLNSCTGIYIRSNLNKSLNLTVVLTWLCVNWCITCPTSLVCSRAPSGVGPVCPVRDVHVTEQAIMELTSILKQASRRQGPVHIHRPTCLQMFVYLGDVVMCLNAVCVQGAPPPPRPIISPCVWMWAWSYSRVCVCVCVCVSVCVCQWATLNLTHWAHLLTSYKTPKLGLDHLHFVQYLDVQFPFSVCFSQFQKNQTNTIFVHAFIIIFQFKIKTPIGMMIDACSIPNHFPIN